MKENNTVKYTRKDYMSKNVDHRTYYGQFVTPSVMSLVRNSIGERALFSSTDEHFNDIPLKKWDALNVSIRHMVGRAIAEANGTGGISLSDTVCVAKEAAKRIVEAKLEGIHEQYHSTVKLAVSLGWDVEWSQRNGLHFSKNKKGGKVEIWSVYDGWQCADLKDGRFCNHRGPSKDLESALRNN